MGRIEEIDKEINRLKLEKEELTRIIENQKKEVGISTWFFANVKIKTILDLNKNEEEILTDAFHKLEEIISTELQDEDLELTLTIDGMTNINRNIDEIEIIISDEKDNILIEGDYKER